MDLLSHRYSPTVPAGQAGALRTHAAGDVAGVAQGPAAFPAHWFHINLLIMGKRAVFAARSGITSFGEDFAMSLQTRRLMAGWHLPASHS